MALPHPWGPRELSILYLYLCVPLAIYLRWLSEEGVKGPSYCLKPAIVAQTLQLNMGK